MSLTFVSASTDRVDCGSAAGVDNMTALTALAWINPTALANRAIVSKYRGSVPEGWTFEIKSDGSLECLWTRATTTLNYISAASVISTNTWYCVAVTMDSSGGHFYAGALTTNMVEPSYATSTAGSGAFASDAGRQLFIGNRDASTPNGGFPGRIGPTLLFNRVLTLAEIQSLQFSPRVLSGCRGYWRPGDGGGSSVPDWSGQGNNGTITGATVSANPPLPSAFGYDAFRQLAAPPVSATVDVPLLTLTLTAFLPTVSGGGQTDPNNWSTATVDYQDGRYATAVSVVDSAGGVHRGGIIDFGNGQYAVAMVDTSIGSGVHHGGIIDFGSGQYGVPVVPIESTGTWSGTTVDIGGGRLAVAVALVSGTGGRASGRRLDFGNGTYAISGVQLSGPT